MKFELAKVDMSESDIRRGVKFPSKLTRRLAEFLGIMIGDGHLGEYPGVGKYGTKFVRRYIHISANAKEIEYIDYIGKLFLQLFNVKLKMRIDTKPGAVALQANSKGILEYLNIIGEIPVNRKTEYLEIPIIIKKSSLNMKYAFLRGLADTDFSMSFRNRPGKGHIYPVIKATFKSKMLIRNLEKLFSEMGFKYCTYYNEIRHDKRFDSVMEHNIYLNGRKNFGMWINRIGFSNHKFHRKVNKFLADGFCPPGY